MYSIRNTHNRSGPFPCDLGTYSTRTIHKSPLEVWFIPHDSDTYSVSISLWFRDIFNKEYTQQVWSISWWFRHIFNKEYTQESSIRGLIYFLTIWGHFEQGIHTRVLYERSGLFTYHSCTYSVRNIHKSPLWEVWYISLWFWYNFNKECTQKSSVRGLVYFLWHSGIFNKEYTQKSSMRGLTYFLMIWGRLQEGMYTEVLSDMSSLFLYDLGTAPRRNAHRSPLWDV